MKGLITLLSLVLIGCTTTAPAAMDQDIPEYGVTRGYKCNADKAKSLLGQLASVETGTLALQMSGAKVLRWIEPDPNVIITTEYRQDRLGVSYNANMIITRINCG